jgi:protein-tyrosine phosphatase
MADDRFAVLFVCHANLCRSPMAERLARAAYGRRFGFDATDITVSSAGTHAWVGCDMHPGTAQVLQELDVDAGGFVSRQLTPQLLAGADLVLAADRGQRSACVSMLPDVMNRTFTIRQFARMAETIGAPPESGTNDGATDGSPAAQLRAQRDHLVRGRHRLQPVDPTQDDLADPVRQPIDAFRACAVEIQRSLDAVLGAITTS